MISDGVLLFMGRSDFRFDPASMRCMEADLRCQTKLGASQEKL